MGHVRVDLGGLYILVYDITRNILNLMVDSGVASCHTSLRDNIDRIYFKKPFFEFEQRKQFGRCLGAGENNEM